MEVTCLLTYLSFQQLCSLNFCVLFSLNCSTLTMRSLEGQLGWHIFLIDGCRTQMVNSQKCCWQIVLLLEQFGSFCGSLSWRFSKCWAVTSWLRSIQAAFGSWWKSYNLIKVHCLYLLSLTESLPARKHSYS